MPPKGSTVKYKVDVNPKTLYKLYKDRHKRLGKFTANYKLWKSVVWDYNLMVRDKILNDADKIYIPKLGELYIKKRPLYYASSTSKKWPIDRHKTKESGVMCYIEDDYYYKWAWNKSRSLIRRSFYKFIPDRMCKYFLYKKLVDGMDYYES